MTLRALNMFVGRWLNILNIPKERWRNIKHHIHTRSDRPAMLALSPTRCRIDLLKMASKNKRRTSSGNGDEAQANASKFWPSRTSGFVGRRIVSACIDCNSLPKQDVWTSRINELLSNHYGHLIDCQCPNPSKTFSNIVKSFFSP